MKLVISELEERTHYTSREASYIIRELMSRYGWSHIETYDLHYSSGSLESLLTHRFSELPEVLLCWEGYYFLNARKEEINSLKCTKYVMCDDLHTGEEHDQDEKLEAFSIVSTILSTYAYTFRQFYPTLPESKRVVWVPHSASPDFLIAFNDHPADSILLSGAINEVYPLRMHMRRLCDEGSYPIVMHQHPGYHCDFDHEKNTNIGRGYAKRINEYRVAFTDSSVYRYSVAKYFEIPATGSLLLADRAISDPLRALGFIEGVHYIGVSSDDLEAQIEYVLDEKNRNQVDRLRRNAQKLVWKRHKTSDRAKLIDAICIR